MKTQVYEAHWTHTPQMEEWLSGIAQGRTLNVCCGASKVGDVRVDVTPEAEGRNMKADLFHLPFKPLSFDTVICDPPFDYYREFKWIRDLAILSRKRLILSSDSRPIYMKSSVWSKRLFFDDSGIGFLRLYWVFDRENQALEAFDFDRFL